jgi:type I restriction enzyme M protein
MKSLIDELIQRFIAAFPPGEDAPLHPDQIQTSDALKAPLCTLLVHGAHEGSNLPLAIVLMTIPSQAADAPAILEFVIRRARAHKAPYFVTWTLREAMLWRTPKPGIPASRDSLEKLRNYPHIYEIGAGDQEPITELTKLKVLESGRAILHDLERLLKDEALELVQIDATYFVNRLLEAVHRLLPIVADSLHHRLQTEVGFRQEISDWAVRHAIAGSATELEFAQSIARQIIYRLLGKVLFYQSLRRSARQLPKLDFQGVDSSQVLPLLRDAFGQALKIDYHAVFEEDLPDTIKWPSEASRELATLINDFNTRDFAHLPQDVVGTVFEQLIPPEERSGLGQFFTNENLCDFITAFCIRSPQDLVLDPTCGTGTFLIRAYDRLRWLGQHDHTQLLSQLWGVDIAPFPAELATINLFRQRIAEHGNFPRIICRDFFRISPGDRFPFPPPKMDLEHPEMIEEPFPHFDAIIGNFPYISADKIEKYEAGYLEFLRQRLMNGWFAAYPQLFYYKNRKEQEKFEKLVAQGQHHDYKGDKLQSRLSTYADLYAYLFFHTARFLKPGGRLGIVTSNAWLDVNFGYELQKFFLNRFKIVAILESRCEPWFFEASVNTVVTILERCDSPEVRDANLVHFVKVKRPLADLIPGDPVIEAVSRWQNLANQVARIERAGLKYTNTYPLGLITEEDDDFRIRIRRQGELRAEVEREGKTVKWGQYLRAPQVYFDILRHGKLCLLREIAIPLRGGTTRINEFFYVPEETASRFNIEEEYLWPLIKSPKETNTILIDPSDLKFKVFVCRKTKDELKNRGHVGALKYIEWGEKQRWSDGSFWKEGVWVRNRKPGWWALPESETHYAQIFLSKGVDERHIQRFSPEKLIPDQRLYYLKINSSLLPDLIAAILNSSVTSLVTELIVPLTAGDGLCELRVEDARDYLLVPDIRKLQHHETKRIGEAFKQLLKRDILSVHNEVKREDRRAIDSAILEFIGLDPKRYLKHLYEGICELVRERIELGRTRNKVRKTRARGERAEKKTTEEVLDEILPQGPKRFPDDFFSTAAAAGSKVAVELPELPLLFNSLPMFMGVYTADDSFKRHVKNAAEGKFLLYAQQAGQKVARLPEKTVEVTRTVANYEKYLRELRQHLYDAYYRRTMDTRTAARLTQAAFDRFRLPAPEA